MVEKEFDEVEKILERIRPALKDHQGSLKIVNIKDGVVYLQFVGGCSDCPVVDVSLKNVVDIALKGNLNWVKKVEILPAKIELS
ncbi:Fe-S cluster biogenesis protein NfuA [Hydrogenivirga caldilitoris]|uniref:Fe-S cluster biogenesis protein NfuA n=1 Tax=Hydrogenivirga caldilitoris TaxID=246264 RepID=A0A497XW85_9AQUI|nr:NifU family protein [Hydrogenivirga caldilitoris]RLJ71033.1 Fe-S cluster biogenesis protein NfuA [Hydrogenivirga caldilitoris]